MNRYPITILESRALSPTALELVVKRSNGSAFPYFVPGQYATLSFPTNKSIRGERSFSIASAPTDPTVLRFGIRVGGHYTDTLRQLKPGDSGMVALPFGTFTFNPSRDQRALFIAGGIGITPFLSMIRTATAEKLPNKLTLLYSVRSIDDIPYRSELEVLAKANPNFQYAIAVTSGAIPEHDVFIQGRITSELIQQALGNQTTGQSYFLCGPPAFMAAMLQALRGNGVPKHLVRTERFSAGSSDIIERKTAIPWLTMALWGAATAAVLGVIVKAENVKRAASIIPAAPATNTPSTNAATQAPTNTAAIPTNSSPALTNAAQPTTNNAAAPTNTTPTPVVVQPAPQPVVQQVPVAPRTRMS
jgi:ferredoxin-NADP reductase